MNNNFIESRIQANVSGGVSSYMQKNLNLSNDQLVNRLFLDVLSRPPSGLEFQQAINQLANGASTRTNNAVDLLWTLFNKVDFIFNY